MHSEIRSEGRWDATWRISLVGAHWRGSKENLSVEMSTLTQGILFGGQHHGKADTGFTRGWALDSWLPILDTLLRDQLYIGRGKCTLHRLKGNLFSAHSLELINRQTHPEVSPSCQEPESADQRESRHESPKRHISGTWEAGGRAGIRLIWVLNEDCTPW